MKGIGCYDICTNRRLLKLTWSSFSLPNSTLFLSCLFTNVCTVEEVIKLLDLPRVIMKKLTKTRRSSYLKIEIKTFRLGTWNDEYQVILQHTSFRQTPANETCTISIPWCIIYYIVFFDQVFFMYGLNLKRDFSFCLIKRW